MVACSPLLYSFSSAMFNAPYFLNNAIGQRFLGLLPVISIIVAMDSAKPYTKNIRSPWLKDSIKWWPPDLPSSGQAKSILQTPLLDSLLLSYSTPIIMSSNF
jgi:hypothetical protein